MTTTFPRPLSPVAADMLLIGLDAERLRRRMAVATFNGMQETGDPEWPALELWTLRERMGKHPAGSTVVRETLDRLLAEAQPPAVLGGEVRS